MKALFLLAIFMAVPASCLSQGCVANQAPLCPQVAFVHAQNRWWKRRAVTVASPVSIALWMQRCRLAAQVAAIAVMSIRRPLARNRTLSAQESRLKS